MIVMNVSHRNCILEHADMCQGQACQRHPCWAARSGSGWEAPQGMQDPAAAACWLPPACDSTQALARCAALPWNCLIDGQIF